MSSRLGTMSILMPLLVCAAPRKANSFIFGWLATRIPKPPSRKRTRTMKNNPVESNAGGPLVVGTGLIALDVVLDDNEPDRQRCYAGGTCGNVLTILSYLGWLAVPVSRIRRDRA